MKNQLYFLFVIFLFSLPVLAQTQAGKVIYKIKDDDKVKEFAKEADADDYAIEYTKKWLADINRGLPYLEYTLIFNKNEARFETPSQQMKTDHGIDLNKTIKYVSEGGMFYTNLQEHIRLHQFHYVDHDWLVERSNDSLDWKITNETKKINGYTVRKAELEFEGSQYAKPQKITAWFAPDLPFQFGPLHYAGLPGLILEVHHQHWTFYADEIKLSEKEKKIKRPTKGKHLTLEEYKKESRKIQQKKKSDLMKKQQN